MRSLATILALLLVAGLAFAGDLYKVEVQSQLDAHLLSALGVEPVAHVTGGYLVIVDASKSDRLADSRLAVELLLANVDKSELALDNRLDKANVWKYPVLYQEGDFRLFRVTRAELSVAPTDLQPIRSQFCPRRHLFNVLPHRSG